ncbi:MAG: hypothetical protein AAB798_01425 [Patescibacteria group bacterium]
MMRHLHIDLFDDPPSSFIDQLRVLGFWDASFRVPYPDGHAGPAQIWTYKSTKSAECDVRWLQALNIMSMKWNGWSIPPGFMERELIVLDTSIEADHPFNPHMRQPFILERYRLPEGGFKGSETHLVCDYNQSDPWVMEWFTEMGMVPAILPKRQDDRSSFDKLVLTAQGDKREIARIVKELRDIIPKLGGVKGCSIKFEVMEGHLLFGGFTTARLPPIVRI